MTDMLVVEVVEAAGARHLTLHGRAAWAMQQLLHAGESGCTPLHNPAPRWSGYVHKLRQAGLEIETVHERHGDDFPGLHARYVLRSQVRLVKARTEGHRTEGHRADVG